MTNYLLIPLLTLAMITPIASAAPALKEVPFTEVILRDDFWSKRIETNRKVTIWHNIDE